MKRRHRLFSMTLAIIFVLCLRTSLPVGAQDSYYRVRTSWANAESQIGAFRVLSNAIEHARSHSGYRVFDANGAQVYPGGESVTPAPAPKPAPTLTPAAPMPSGSYTVRSGDTLWKIGRIFGIHYLTIAKANDLAAPYWLRVGQVLTIPGTGSPATPAPTPVPTPAPTPAPATSMPSGSYKVRSGDTLWKIGQTYGISYLSIARANGLVAPYWLRVGQVLTIPGTGSPSTPAPTPVPTPAPTPAPATSMPSGSYKVRSGDTLWKIGQTFGISYLSIARANGLVAPYWLRVGQVLAIPGSGSAGSTTPDTPAPDTPAPEPGSASTKQGSISVQAQAPGDNTAYLPIPSVRHEAGAYKVTQIPITGYEPNQIGMGYFVQTPNGHTVVIDGGMQKLTEDKQSTTSGYGTGEEQNVRGWLAQNANNRVDAWFMSHMHNDHVRVPAAIIRNPGGINVARWYGATVSKSSHDTKTPEEAPEESAFQFGAVDIVKQQGKWTEISSGQTYTIDGLIIEILHINTEQFWRLNDESLVAKLTFGTTGISMLILSDQTDNASSWIAGTFGSRLRADIVQQAHHGIDRLTEVYEQARPSVILVPVGISAAGSLVQTNVQNAAAHANGTVYYAYDRWVTVIIR